jgi:hypothetical protein
MIARGYEDDEIVARILTATEAAAPGSERWNWSREEKQIRDMIRTGRSKGYAVKSADKPKPVLALISGGGAALKADNAEPAKAKKEPKAQSSDDITACGEAVIGVWRDRYGPLIHAKGTTYVYSEGIWIEWGDEQAQRLRSLVQEGCQNLRLKPSTSTLNAIFRYVMERPYLRQDSIEFDNHGLLVAADACLDLTTFEVVPHSPDHYATMKSAATLEGDRAHPALDEFLSSAFADRPEAREIISTLQEWFGAAIVPLAVKQRGHKKGLFAHGPSRCSKTQVSELARYLLGREQVCGTRMADFDDRFGVEPLIGMRGWIADDAIGESEYLNSEIYKVVVTGEQTGARRKGGKNWNGRLGIPVLLTANSLPRVRDQSDAVYNRSLILPMTVVRPEDAPEPAGFSCIADKVGMTELTGLLWWAIEGWKRLAARGTFAPPPVMLEANR